MVMRIVVLAATIAAVVLSGSAGANVARSHGRCLVPGLRKTVNQLWKPDMAAAISYAHSRTGDIAFAVRTDHTYHGYRANHVEWSASVLKAMLMVAYLNRPSVRSRALDSYDNSLLYPMITRSDNAAASSVDTIVGDSGLDALAHRVGMTHFQAISPIWGESHITAADQTKFFFNIDNFIVKRHRAYGMHLLASVTPSQRWGIGEVAPRGWHLYFKGGWGYGTGLMDHQVVLLKRGCARVSLAVLTMYDGSHDYGKDTLKGIFERLLHGFPQPRKRHR
jgi:Beta-lactamase enzyme family